MRSFFLLLTLFLLLSLSGCTPSYDYTVHKPRAYFDQPTKKNLRKILRRKIGNDYVWAEEGPHEFDCSGLVYYAYGTMNLPLPRVASAQSKVGRYVSRDQLQYGDLIFFDTTSRHSGKITHVGIYIGNNRFEHAANERQGVVVTPLDHPYYGRRIVTCRRILPSNNNEVSAMPAKPFKQKLGFGTTPKSNDNEVCEKCYEVTDRATDTSGRYFIQVGIFSGKPKPAFIEHLRVSGYGHKVKYIVKNGHRMTQVLVGPFETRSKAKSALVDAQALFNPGSFVVTE